MRLKVKRGVTPESFVLIAAVVNAAIDLDIPWDVVITAGTNGTHITGSRHATGQAIDVRAKNFKTRAMKARFLEIVHERLGPGYDCLLESEGTANEHFHLEKDPT